MEIIRTRINNLYVELALSMRLLVLPHAIALLFLMMLLLNV